MFRKIRPAVGLAVLFSLIFSAPAFGGVSWRGAPVVRALDYLHAHQRSGGGFGEYSSSDPSITPWAVMAIAAARQDEASWSYGGRTPLIDKLGNAGYLENLNLETAAAQAGSQRNVPASYARFILAYYAAGRMDIVFAAGTRPTDLLGKLYSFQDLTDYHFSPMTTGNRQFAAIETTAWAVLALHAAGETGTRVDSAVQWLEAQQAAGGGWASQPGSTSDTSTTPNVNDTALVMQAIAAAAPHGAGTPAGTAIAAGLAFLSHLQRSDGGFPMYPGDHTYAEPTAWAIQAIRVAGQDPQSSTWTKGSYNPVTRLHRMITVSGAYPARAGVSTSLVTTSEAIIALSGVTFPVKHPTDPEAVRFRPVFVKPLPIPAAHARIKSHTVVITAHYADNANGTGINLWRVRVIVDGTSRTAKARITRTYLYLKLTGVPNGTHDLTIAVPDYAGNTVTTVRTFTVAVATSSGGSTGGGGSSGTGGSGSGGTGGGSTYPYPTTTPTPTTTLSPTPGASTSPSVSPGGGVSGTPLTPSPGSSFNPTPQPSTSASVTGQTASGKGGGHGTLATGLLGGSLVAMLPLGALLSYVVRRHQVSLLSGAGAGRLLPAGGTPWWRFKSRLYALPHSFGFRR